MKTVSCCFAIFLVTASPATPVIYSLKFLIIFNIWVLILLRSVAAITVKISVYEGLVFDSCMPKLLKIEP